MVEAYRVYPIESEEIEVPLRGRALLENPLLNKGQAFTVEERRALGLEGLLPDRVATLEEQVEQAFEQYQAKETTLERYVYLASLQDRNEALFYRLVLDNITDMMPVIYTPGVGLACQRWSHIYRRPRGLYIAYPHRDNLDEMLANAPIGDPRVIVVTDGERILGLGDQGVGGMGIPVGKLSLYTLCAGVHPATTLPITLDVGTNNKELLNDPMYLGWRHERVRGAEYDEFIEKFVQAVMKAFPNVLLQWEDFAKNNASRLLKRYHDRLCTFNDDIQGTGAVTLAGLLTAVDMSGTRISDHRIVMLGAGSAAVGIADQIITAMQERDGTSEADARATISMLDSRGLVHTGREDIYSEPDKVAYAQPAELVKGWAVNDPLRINLEEVVRYSKPTVLIGTSSDPGSFTETIIREMAAHCERPIVLPLSNPTSKCEADPKDVLFWTQGRALVATGSPFPDVHINGQTVRIGQCNNSFIFPGVGLGVIASKAHRVTDQMMYAAANALANYVNARNDPLKPLYPPLNEVRDVSRQVAISVAKEAVKAGLADPMSDDEIEARVNHCMWEPHYSHYHYVKG